MDLSQVIVFNIWWDEKSGTFSVRASSPQPTIQSHHEKNIRQSQRAGHSTKSWTSSPQNCQGYQNWGKSEKLSPAKPKDIWWQKVVCYPGWHSRTEKGNWEKTIKFKEVQSSVNGNVSINVVSLAVKKAKGGKWVRGDRNSLYYLHNRPVNLLLLYIKKTTLERHLDQPC